MADDEDDDEAPQDGIPASQPAGDEWAAFRSAQAVPVEDEWAAFRAKPSTDEWAAFRTKPEPEAESGLWSGVRSFAHGLLPSAAGVAGIPAGIAAGALLGLPEGGIGAIPGALVGGIAAYTAASKAQDVAQKALGIGDSRQMAADVEAHPYATTAGSIASALPFFGVGSGIQAAYRAAGAVGGAGIEAAQEYLQGQPIDPAQLALAGAGGALLQKPTALGEAIGSRAAAAIGRPQLWHGAEATQPAAGEATASAQGVASRSAMPDTGGVAKEAVRSGADESHVGDPQNKVTRSATEYPTTTNAEPPQGRDMRAAAAWHDMGLDETDRELLRMNLEAKLDKYGTLNYDHIDRELTNKLDTTTLAGLKQSLAENPRRALDALSPGEAPQAPTAATRAGVNVLNPGQVDPTVDAVMRPAGTPESPEGVPGAQPSTPEIDAAVARAPAERQPPKAVVEAGTPDAPPDRPLANRVLNQPQVLNTEAARRGMTPEALKAQAQEVVRQAAQPAELNSPLNEPKLALRAEQEPVSKAYSDRLRDAPNFGEIQKILEEMKGDRKATNAVIADIAEKTGVYVGAKSTKEKLIRDISSHLLRDERWKNLSERSWEETPAPGTTEKTIPIDEGLEYRTQTTARGQQEVDRLYPALRQELNRIGLPDLALRAANRLKLFIDGHGREGEARGTSIGNLIHVAVGGGRAEGDIFGTLHHEALHGARRLGLFNDSEWKLLSDASNAKWRKQYDIDHHYKQWGEDAKVEEGIAHAYEDWAKQRREGGVPAIEPVAAPREAGLFQRLKNFITAIGNAFRRTPKLAEDIRARSPDDVFSAFYEGKVGARERTGKIDPDLHFAEARTDREPVVVPPHETQPSVGESLTNRINASIDKLFDIGRDIQMKVAPMATGTQESMATAKDFANLTRRNQYEWSRIDQDVERRFTPEQRKRMWDAADEESVLRQEGKADEHKGLATLTPEERAGVTELQARAQAAWQQARDVGMVQGEGLPSYTPRMLLNIAEGGQGPRALDRIGANLRITTAQLLRRKHLTAEETEAAARTKFGEGTAIARDIRSLPLATARLENAVAGRQLINNIKEIGKHTGQDTVVEGRKPGPDWFTIDHPAFYTRRVSTDNTGNTVIDRVPIYVRSDFEGPLRAVLAKPSGALYSAMMNLKGKTMGLIMNSPLIHNAVEWGRALPAMPGKVATFKVYFEGNRAKNDPATMREAIDAGIVPIGKRFFNQDISSIMEEPNLTPGRSWTSQVLGFVPELFDPKAGAAVKRSIDRAGDFWHNTLLWDRIGDLQMGLYTNFRDDLVAKGIDPQTSARAAAHWANRYAGALPQEAMSDAARKFANMLLFSRSFTLGNLGAMKDMFNGLPRDVRAQISRDVGSLDPKAEGYIKSLARRKAISIVMLDMGLMYLGNSLLQSGVNMLRGDKTLDQEGQGYAARLSAALKQVREHPLSLLQPLSLIGSLSSTAENEPGKQDRIKVGYTKDGTAIYARNPVGKIGEEFTGYLTGPLDMLRRKLGTIARPAWQILANDKGFGRKVYDPNADTPEKYLKNMGAIAQHLATAQEPDIQLGAAADLATGQGDKKLNLLQTLGPVAGVTFSKGAPGGPAQGELYRAQEQHRFQVNEAMPEIRRMIQRGDTPQAVKRMIDLGIPPGLRNFYVRTTLNPAARMTPRAVQDFYRYATPEQRARFQQDRAAQPRAP